MHLSKETFIWRGKEGKSMIESLEEFLDENRRLVDAFVAGAKFWEYHKTGATMWASDRELIVRKEAEEKYMPKKGPPLPLNLDQ